MRKTQRLYFTHCSYVKYRFTNLFSKADWRQHITVLFIITVIYILCGVLLSNISLRTVDSDNGWWEAFIRLLSPANQNRFETSSVLTCIIAVVGLLIVPLLTSVLTNFFSGIASDFENGLIDYKMRGHVVLIGSGDVAVSVIRELISDNMILLLTSSDVRELRKRLSIALDEALVDRIVILSGSTSAKEDMLRLCLETALELYIIGDESVCDRDVANMDTLEGVAGILTGNHRRRKSKLTCHLMLENKSSFGIYQAASVNRNIEGTLDFIPFDRYEMYARKVLVVNTIRIGQVGSASGYLPLEGIYCLDKDSDRHVHLVIVGMSCMGIAMAIEAAHLAHYPNFVSKSIKSRITFIDSDAAAGLRFMMSNYRNVMDLSCWHYTKATSARYGVMPNDNVCNKYHGADLGDDFLDIEWEFIDGDVREEPIRQYLVDAVNDANCIMTVAVCLDDSRLSVTAATGLPEEVRVKSSQILVYQRNGGSLIRNVGESVLEGAGQYARLRPFGVYENTFVSDDVSLRTAKLINYAYSLIFSGENVDWDAALRNVPQDILEERWNEIPSTKSLVSAHWSSLYNAMCVWTKIRNISSGSVPESYTDDELDILQQVEHNRWNMEELLLGFRPVSGQENKSMDVWEKSVRNELKHRMVHVDIRSYESLVKYDGESVRYDRDLSKLLPYMYRNLIQYQSVANPNP